MRISQWMANSATSLLTLGGLVCLTVVVACAASELTNLSTRLSSVLEHKEPQTVQVLTEAVERPNGRTVTVTTTRNDNESEAEFVARHDATVAELLKE